MGKLPFLKEWYVRNIIDDDSGAKAVKNLCLFVGWQAFLKWQNLNSQKLSGKIVGFSLRIGLIFCGMQGCVANRIKHVNRHCHVRLVLLFHVPDIVNHFKGFCGNLSKFGIFNKSKGFFLIITKMSANITLVSMA